MRGPDHGSPQSHGACLPDQGVPGLPVAGYLKYRAVGGLPRVAAERLDGRCPLSGAMADADCVRNPAKSDSPVACSLLGPMILAELVIQKGIAVRQEESTLDKIPPLNVEA